MIRRSSPPKRTPPRRSAKPTARGGPIRRSGKRPKARKADPSKRRFAKHRCDPYREWLKLEACCITGKRTGEWLYLGGYYAGGYVSHMRVLVDPAHTRPRSLGADDLYQCLPLARHLHEEQERIRWPRFEKKYGIDRHAIAKAHTERFLALHPELGDQREDLNE